MSYDRLAGLSPCPFCRCEMWVLKTQGTIPVSEEMPYTGDVFKAHGAHSDACPIRDTRPFKTEHECTQSWSSKRLSLDAL